MGGGGSWPSAQPACFLSILCAGLGWGGTYPQRDEVSKATNAKELRLGGAVVAYISTFRSSSE